MTETKKEIIRIAALIYIERLKKWPEVEDDVRVTDSVKAASQIVGEANAHACQHEEHQYTHIKDNDSWICSRCGKKA